jgi:hypothetical protein
VPHAFVSRFTIIPMGRRSFRIRRRFRITSMLHLEVCPGQLPEKQLMRTGP